MRPTEVRKALKELKKSELKVIIDNLMKRKSKAIEKHLKIRSYWLDGDIKLLDKYSKEELVDVIFIMLHTVHLGKALGVSDCPFCLLEGSVCLECPYAREKGFCTFPANDSVFRRIQNAAESYGYDFEDDIKNEEIDWRRSVLQALQRRL